eukprot:6224844-Amphidinium_carterae.1
MSKLLRRQASMNCNVSVFVTLLLTQIRTADEGVCVVSPDKALKCGWSRKGCCSLVDRFSTCNFTKVNAGGQHVFVCQLRTTKLLFQPRCKNCPVWSSIIPDPVTRELLDRRTIVEDKAGQLGESSAQQLKKSQLAEL